MAKKDNRMAFLSTGVCLLPVLIGLILWNRLPEEIAVHFGTDGAANGWAAKAVVVFGIPVLLTVVHLLCIFLIGAGPGKEDTGEKMKRLIFWICPMVSLLVTLSSYAVSLGSGINIGALANGFVGILFVIAGSYLPACRPNYFVGIKLPWTLGSADNWEKVHRLGGWCFIFSGILFLCNILLQTSLLIYAAVFAAVVIPIAYSYYLHRKGI